MPRWKDARLINLYNVVLRTLDVNAEDYLTKVTPGTDVTTATRSDRFRQPPHNPAAFFRHGTNCLIMPQTVEDAEVFCDCLSMHQRD